MGALEIVDAGIDVAALQLLLVGVGDRVDEIVQAPPGGSQTIEQDIQARGIGHVGRQDQLGAELLGQGPHTFEQGLALIGDRHLGTLRMQRLGDPPGEGAVVGNAHDQASLALHERLRIGHRGGLRGTGPGRRRILVATPCPRKGLDDGVRLFAVLVAPATRC